MKENDINHIKINPVTGQQSKGLSEPDIFPNNQDPSLISKFEELKTTKSQLREKEQELELEKHSRNKSSKTRQVELKNIIEYLKTKVKDLIAFIRQKSPGDGNLSFKTIPEKNDFPKFY